MRYVDRLKLMLSRRRLKFTMRRILRTLGKATGTSHQIALGLGIGFFVAWLPIIGIQMIVAITVCKLFNANKVVPIFPIWLTNPVTFVPIYSFNYWVGWLIVGGPPLSNITTALKAMITVPEGIPEKGLAGWWVAVKHGFSELISMGWDMQIPLWLGCAVIGLALAIPSYYLCKKFVDSFREEVKRKVQMRRERRRRANLRPELGGIAGGGLSGKKDAFPPSP